MNQRSIDADSFSPSRKYLRGKIKQETYTAEFKTRAIECKKYLRAF